MTQTSGPDAGGNDPGGNDPAAVEATVIDFARLQAEIDDEVRRRRAAGDFPPGLERELDAAFARYAPAGSTADFGEVLAAAETQSFVHVDVPTGSRLPGVGYLKAVLRKLMSWYLRFVAAQVTAFAGSITRAVGLLGRRVDSLEKGAATAGARSLDELGGQAEGPDLGSWIPFVVERLGGPDRRRVLHAECGPGALLAALAATGADVYGVEPIEARAVAAGRRGLDVRADAALDHLRALPDASLGGLVLSGCVERLPLGIVLELADQAVRVLAPSAVLVVLSGTPSAWAAGSDPVVADLAPGRPLHPATWCHLLEVRGFTGVSSSPGPDAVTLGRLAGDVPGAAVINANSARLEALLFGPASYAVVGLRP